MKISILTATYNRASYLINLYQSIIRNKERTPKVDCEWIIIDDGSVDETKSKVQEFIGENKIDIIYRYQSNSGKMSAINYGTELASGDFIIDCDSDDYLTNYAFELIKNYSRRLFENENIYAIAFLKKDEKGHISGNRFIGIEDLTTMFDLYFKYNIGGEKILVYNAKIRKKFEHELVEGENFVTEARMYHKMDDKYKILCVNDTIEIGEYIDDGYTRNIDIFFRNCPNGFYYYFKEILEKDMTGCLREKKIYAIKHYILFGYLAGKKFNISSIRNLDNKILYTILYIPGLIKSKKFKYL